MKDRSDQFFDPRIADWLEDGPDRAPAAVLQTLAAALPSIPQRSTWRIPWRFSAMTRFAVAAVLAGVVVIAAIAVLSRQSVGPGAEPSVPTSSPAPSSGLPTVFASPTAVPTPNSTPDVTPRPLDTSDRRLPLSAGDYRIDQPFAAPFAVTLTDGWRLNDLEDNIVGFGRGGVPQDAIGFFSVLILDQVYPDPCHTEGGAVSVSSAEELADALTSMAGFEVGPIADVSVNGVSGKSFTLTSSIDTETAGCSGGEWLWIGTYRQGGSPTDIGTVSGVVERMTVLDVEGIPVLVSVGAGADSPANQAAAEELVATLQFDRPSTASPSP